MHHFTEYVNPHLGKLLESIEMDKSYIRGEGCYLYDDENNQYLDCIAAYGALPFGYNHREIWDCIMDYRQSGEPSFVQPSVLRAAGDLAKKLIEVAPEGMKYVTFTNSGAEAVEAAIKLCRSATGRMGILAANNSFHGKTLGALSATGRSAYQQAFGAPVKGFHYIDFNDLDGLERELDRCPDHYAAFIVEPIQGEGGIVVPVKGYLRAAKEVCKKHGVMLVVDEIQTGLGRTGTLFACEQEGVTPDVLLIAKALGGGIIPIGACICTEEVYNEEFADKHSSTFAGNSLACRVGLKALEMLTRDDHQIIKEVWRKGEKLLGRLNDLKQKYPDLIKSIRGKGFMLGIEFDIDRDSFPHNLLGVMAEQEMLTPVISSYLLNQEHIRVAPTLNGNKVIRIEPPLVMSEAQCDQIVTALDHTLSILNERNTAKFLSYLIDVDPHKVYKTTIHKMEEKVMPSKDIEEGRFAFLLHPIYLENYAEFDESLSSFDQNEIKQLTDRWNDMVEPFVIASARINSKNGAKAYGDFICVPKTAEELMNLPKAQVMSELKAAIDLGKKRGAKIVGLGAYTSVASMGGLYLKNEGIALTTGNSYTVVSTVDAIMKAMERVGDRPEKATAAIIGATGAIGRGAAILLSELITELTLVGNPQNHEISMNKLFGIYGEILQHAAKMIKEHKKVKPGTVISKLIHLNGLPSHDASPSQFTQFAKTLKSHQAPIRISTEADDALPDADVIITATSHFGRFITAEKLKYGAIVCDISRPSNVSEEVETERPDVLVIDGGVIEVPGLPSLGWNFGFEKGLAYACMSETMILALERHYKHTSLGSSGISLESIMMMRELAKKHGFKVASFKSFNRPLPEEKWQTVIRARKKVLAR